MINFQRIHRVYHALNFLRKGRFLCFEEINFKKNGYTPLSCNDLLFVIFSKLYEKFLHLSTHS